MQRTRHLTEEQKQFAELYDNASPDEQKYIFRLIALTAAHGDTFLKEAQAEGERGGREAFIAVIDKWCAITNRDKITALQA